MHAYRRFVQEAMDQGNLRPADVHRCGGPSPQVLSRILNDSREQLIQRPDQETLEKLATGLPVQMDALLAAVAEAMGLPVQVRVAGLTEASNEQLLAEVRRRMGATREEHDERQDHDARERRFAQGGGDDAGAGQKTSPGAGRLGAWDLAAHPVMPLAADRIDAEFDQVGEQSQDVGGDDWA